MISLGILNEAISKKEVIKEEISKNREWGFDQSTEVFVKGMSFLTPQSYGARMENFLKHKLGTGCKKVNASENKADVVLSGKYIEVKCSLLTNTNSKLNLVQIRLYQDLDMYLCVAFDIRNNLFEEYVYLLTKKQMNDECSLLGATSDHGTKNSVKQNKNVELRISIIMNKGNDVFERWNDKYRLNSIEEIKCIVKKNH